MSCVLCTVCLMPFAVLRCVHLCCVTCTLCVVGCGLWAVGCGLWAVGCGLCCVLCPLSCELCTELCVLHFSPIENRQPTQRQPTQPKPPPRAAEQAQPQGAQGLQGGAGYNQAGMPEWAKDKVNTTFGTNVEDWPTGSKLISACDIIPLLNELVSEHGEVPDGSPSWVKRPSAYVNNQRFKRKKQKPDQVDSRQAVCVAMDVVLITESTINPSLQCLHRELVQDLNATDLEDALDLGPASIPLDIDYLVQEDTLQA
jgi:hypothetical protein